MATVISVIFVIMYGNENSLSASGPTTCLLVPPLKNAANGSRVVLMDDGTHFMIPEVQRLRSLRYEGIVLMRSQMKRQIEAPNLEVGSHMSCDIL